MTSLAVLVITFAMYPVAVWRRRHAPGMPCRGQIARMLAVVVAATNLVFLVGLVASLRQLGDTIPLPARSLALLSLPIISLALTGLLPAFALTAWRERWWTRGERLRVRRSRRAPRVLDARGVRLVYSTLAACASAYSTLAACAVIFIVFLNYWKLLGFRY